MQKVWCIIVIRKIACKALFLSLSVSWCTLSSAKWTQRHNKTYALPTATQSTVLSSTLQKWNIKPFSQLLFSWNARKPKKGFLRFYARVRGNKTKKWLCWHTLADWGSKVQKSYMSNGQCSTHHFVRIELGENYRADAFEIKVEAHQGACLKDLYTLGVTTSLVSSMQKERIPDLRSLESVRIKGVPALSQWHVKHPETHRLCSPTSLSMMLGYLNKQKVDPAQFAKSVYDEGLGAFGSWPFNIAAAFEAAKGKYHFFVTRLQNFAELHAFLKKQIPIAVSVRGVLEGAPRPYPNGHLMLVVGYDARKKQVLCHDPAQLHYRTVQTRYPLHSFLEGWERSHRLAYIPQSRMGGQS